MDNEIALRPYVYEADEKGIYARWRGSALAFPILDAHISPSDNQTLCVLHRGDSFIMTNKNTTNRRLMCYRWNGFGFSGFNDSIQYRECREYYDFEWK
jgi:poly-gamma-glutamate synthesis protein (capsule biosynthesis protein)